MRGVSPYLGTLEQHRATLIAALHDVVDERMVDTAQRKSARLSVRLDASPLDDETADAVDAGAQSGASSTLPSVAGNGRAASTGGWVDALRLDGMPTQDIAAIEYRGVRAAQHAESDLSSVVLEAPTATLAHLHHLIAEGLLDRDRLGVLRSTSRALHDGGQGRVIFHAPAPGRLPELMAGFDTWLRTEAPALPPLAAAGIVHFRVLHWRPFEAGNGRLARIASRLVLRATQADPWGLAVPEESFHDAPLRYAHEVAATIRRRGDLRRWNELTGEAIVASLERIARSSRVGPTKVDARAVRAVAELRPGETATLPRLAAETELDLNSAAEQCNLLCWAGLLRRDPGTQGLRYVRDTTDVSGRSGGAGPN